MLSLDSSRPPMDSGPSGGGADAQKKFGGAKAISSDMFFSGSDANVSLL